MKKRPFFLFLVLFVSLSPIYPQSGPRVEFQHIMFRFTVNGENAMGDYTGHVTRYVTGANGSVSKIELRIPRSTGVNEHDYITLTPSLFGWSVSYQSAANKTPSFSGTGTVTSMGNFIDYDLNISLNGSPCRMIIRHTNN